MSKRQSLLQFASRCALKYGADFSFEHAIGLPRRNDTFVVTAGFAALDPASSLPFLATRMTLAPVPSSGRPVATG